MLHWPLQIDVKVANKSIVRLQNQMDAKEQELGALNIRVWYHNSTGYVSSCTCSSPAIHYGQMQAA